MKSEQKLFAIMGAIVALGAGFLVFNKDGAPETPPTPSPTPSPLDEAKFEGLKKTTLHFKGNPDARITVIEFADFQCPSCRFAYDTGVKLLGKELPEVYFGFRHYPLDDSHPFARPAAMAAEFCAKQDKFWDVYANLMKDAKEDLTEEMIVKAVKATGVDMAAFEAQRKDAALNKLIDADKEAGIAAGVSQTPTFIVHDKQTHKVSILTGYRGLVEALKGVVKLPPIPTEAAPKNALMPPPP